MRAVGWGAAGLARGECYPDFNVSADKNPFARTDADHEMNGTADRPIEGAGGVAFDPDGRVLVIRQRSGPWVFPKGHLDPGENHLEAALREVEEETGVSATCPDPTRTWITRYVNTRGEHRAVTWFSLRADAGAVPVMRERQFPEGAFVEVEEALDRLAYPEDRRLLSNVAGKTLDTPGDDAPKGRR